MRRRLESVGGTLEIQRDGGTFAAIALVPVRAPLPEVSPLPEEPR